MMARMDRRDYDNLLLLNSRTVTFWGHVVQ